MQKLHFKLGVAVIINFSVKNFRSIKNEVILEFNASSDKEHPNFITETKYCNILNAAAVYGLNASGKSNLVRAMQLFSILLNLSVRNETLLSQLIVPFAFDNQSTEMASEFNINFISENVRYEYGFSADRQQIYSEWLFAYPNKKAQLLFTREWQNNKYEYKFGLNYKGDKKRLEEITKNTALFLSVSQSFDKQETASIIKNWFAKFFIENLHLSGNIEIGKSRTIDFIQRGLVTHNEVIQFLTESDLSIVHFDIKEDETSDEQLPVALKEFISKNQIKKQPIVLTEHHVNNSAYQLTLNDESSGTQQMFNFAALVVMVLKNGGELVIDELNNFLHPLLVKHIVGLFGNLETNPQRAQLIFTTHETSIMTTDFLRRDQIWFCDKSKEQSTMLYSAQEFSPRKTDNLEKAYLAGRYGAIPIFTN